MSWRHLARPWGADPHTLIKYTLFSRQVPEPSGLRTRISLCLYSIILWDWNQLKGSEKQGSKNLTSNRATLRFLLIELLPIRTAYPRYNSWTKNHYNITPCSQLGFPNLCDGKRCVCSVLTTTNLICFLTFKRIRLADLHGRHFLILTRRVIYGIEPYHFRIQI